MKILAIIYGDEEVIDIRANERLITALNTNILEIKQYWTGEWEIRVGDNNIGYLWVDLIQKGD